jgi:hypothetical protein
MVMFQTVSITWCFFFTGNTGFPLGQHERTGRTGGQTGGPGQTDCRTAGQTDSSGGRRGGPRIVTVDQSTQAPSLPA